MAPGPGFHLQHAVDVAGELLLHGVRFFVGEGLHADDGLALVEHFDPPIDAGLALRARSRPCLRQLRRVDCSVLPPSSSTTWTDFFVFR